MLSRLLSGRMLISIITASLNSVHMIGLCIESIKRQSCGDFEHIVIDGGSSDETLEILRRHESLYPLQWRSGRDRGISDALNKGLKLARGRYILVIQADDALLSADTFEKAFPLLRDEHCDIRSFPVLVDHPDFGKFLRRPIPILWWNRFKFIFPHQGTFVHRRVFERIGGFREDFSIAMDYDFFYRAILAGCTVKFHREPPVALMGGSGIGTRLNFLRRRLREESLVQEMNERNPLWRMGQIVFKRFYHPYKMWRLPRLKPPRKNRLAYEPSPKMKQKQ